MLLAVIKRRLLLAVVSVPLLMGLLLLTVLPGTVFAQSPSVALNPPQGPPGMLVNGTGSYWTPGDPMQVTWEDGTILASTTLDTQGNFLVSFIVPITAIPGAHTVSFSDLKSGSSQLVTFIVV